MQQSLLSEAANSEVYYIMCVRDWLLPTGGNGSTQVCGGVLLSSPEPNIIPGLHSRTSTNSGKMQPDACLKIKIKVRVLKFES